MVVAVIEGGFIQLASRLERGIRNILQLQRCLFKEIIPLDVG